MASIGRYRLDALLESAGLRAPADPFTPAAEAGRKAFAEVEERNGRCDATTEQREIEWENARDRYLSELKPAPPGPLFQNGKFIALDSIEHQVHIGFNMMHDEDDPNPGEYLGACIEDDPACALRYFEERVRVFGEDQSDLIRVLKIKLKLKELKR